MLNMRHVAQRLRRARIERTGSRLISASRRLPAIITPHIPNPIPLNNMRRHRGPAARSPNSRPAGRRSTRTRGLFQVYPEDERRSRHNQPVIHIHHARHGFDHPGNRRCQTSQGLRVARKYLISIGSGDQVKSPIRSLRTPGNSVFSAGSAD